MVSVIVFIQYNTNSSEQNITLVRKINMSEIISKNYDNYNIKLSNIKSIGSKQLHPQKPIELIEREQENEPDKFNEDYLGFITIPEIKLNESVFRSSGEYYLLHNYKKEYDEVGEVYLDDRSTENLFENGALLNGHAVKNGVRFGSFKKLLDLEEQPHVYIHDYNTDNYYVYRILFVSLIDADNQGVVMNFDDEYQRYSYYSRLYSVSIKKWEEPSLGSKFLLLNSCSYIIDNGRYLVVAERI